MKTFPPVLPWATADERSVWLDRMVRPLHSLLHGFQANAVSGGKCINALLQDIVPSSIGFSDPKNQRSRIRWLLRFTNHFAFDPSACANSLESFYSGDTPNTVIVWSKEK